ncbi:Respiratory-chain NADH dehydrogenase, subunit [Caloramator quimbayensis]|uniref:Respiratory-chain NADH dehydrogenase, subunit n=1 Tax=Caloramator quimbayensis TaxID=1147123 RepID=A0A1T4X1D7_9CLOT|nr:NADH-quinone oxidoreductase subunit C [Caloramator quimbayensis]SKA83257.1 Respiratory-chain NADH dehydrogenase, subunit [Caloramator quimbayensis]
MQKYKKTTINKNQIVDIASNMKKDGRQLVMIHGYVDKEGQNVVSYQYEVKNCIEAYEVVGGKLLPTISHIYDLAAAWPEREFEELIDVKFEGLKIKGRLFMPDTMLEGQG